MGARIRSFILSTTFMNGLIIVDKPSGITSHDVLARLRRVSGQQRMGHLGTLDPMATGVLPVLVGKYTRLAQFFQPLVKSYSGVIRFGFSTDTYDVEGSPSSPVVSPALSLPQVQTAAGRFIGKIQQIPPPFSAKKIAGVRAYRAARQGRPLTLAPVAISVEHFRVETLVGDCAEFSLRISSGGYARSIAHELGEALGVGAHLKALRRTAAGPFTLDQAVSLDRICEAATQGILQAILPHPRTLLAEMPAVTADLSSATRLKNGMQINLAEFSDAPLVRIFAGQKDLIAIGKRVAGTLFQPVAVLV